MECCKTASLLLLLLNGLGMANLFSQATPSAYDLPSVHDIELLLEKSRQEVLTLMEARKALSQESDSLLADITKLKQKKEVGLFDRMQLKKLLKDGEDFAQQFTRIDRLIEAHKETDRSKVEALVDTMNEEILDWLSDRSGKANNQDESLNDRLQAMVTEKNQYQTLLNDSIALTIEDVKIAKNDDDDLLAQKADFVLDQQDRVTIYMARIEQMIRRYQDQNLIQTRMDRLFSPQVETKVRRAEIKSMLILSHDWILTTDRVSAVIEKLKIEKQKAIIFSKKLESQAKELSWLSQYKSKH
jgi:hypothetical protein